MGSYCPLNTTNPNPCPAGTYGSSTCLASSSCSGICASGYFCPPGSISATSQLCGSPSQYCPPGTNRTITTDPGYYSVNLGNIIGNPTNRSSQLICNKGSYCIGGIQNPCPSGQYAPFEGMSVCWDCPAGNYSNAG